MDPRQARAFLTLAREGHFGRAAEALHVAQPALSQRIKILEKELGVQLFDRTTRRVALTEAGRRLVDHARRLVEVADRASEEMARVADGQVGRVSLGFVGTATYEILPRVALRIQRSLPEIELEVHGEMLTPRLLGGLVDFEFDLVVHRPETGPAKISSRLLRTEPIVAVIPSHHRLAKNAEIELRELAGEQFVIHPAGGPNSMHELVLSSCSRAGFQPPSLVEVAETATLVVFVAAGLGVALVPEPVRILGLDGVRFIPIRSGPSLDLILSGRIGDRSPAVSSVAEVILDLFA